MPAAILDNPAADASASGTRALRRSVAELASLKGRAALVAGGAGHVGRAMAEALAEAGARIAILDLDPERCRQAARDIESLGGAATAHPFDLANCEGLDRVCAEIAERHGSLDVVVHAAAWVGTTNVPGWNGPFESQTIEAWNRAMTVNLTSAFALAQASAPWVAVGGEGSMTFVGSIYGSAGPDWRLYGGTSMSLPAGYAASKGGLRQLTRYLATTLAPRVRVNMISPGGLIRGQPALFVERYADRTPLGRMGTEEDLKGAIAYLASGLAAYVTGVDLAVDGGWTVW